MAKIDPTTRLPLDESFKYHGPDEGQKARYQAINEAAKQLAEVILENSPASADQTTAIRCVREARMWANAAIALEK